jgi:DNA-binding MarR family transcriptional regulator
MNERTVQTNVYWLLTQAAMRARQDFARFAEKNYGLTGPQLYTLCVLDPATPAAMHSLSCQLSCDASNVTGMADRLVARGYLIRQDSPADRRVKMLALTPKGLKLRATILADLAATMPEGFTRLNADESATLTALLIKALAPPPTTS